jgi:hypothetical protein
VFRIKLIKMNVKNPACICMHTHTHTHTHTHIHIHSATLAPLEKGKVCEKLSVLHVHVETGEIPPVAVSADEGAEAGQETAPLLLRVM